MHKLLVGITITACTLTLGCQAGFRRDNFASFGTTAEPTGAISLAKALAQADKLADRSVWVRADIAEVSQADNRWITLVDGPHHLRVRLALAKPGKDRIAIPQNASGRLAYIHGVLQRRLVPQELARHYAQAEGKTKEEVERIVGAQPMFAMLATTVWIASSDGLQLLDELGDDPLGR